MSHVSERYWYFLAGYFLAGIRNLDVHNTPVDQMGRFECVRNGVGQSGILRRNRTLPSPAKYGMEELCWQSGTGLLHRRF